MWISWVEAGSVAKPGGGRAGRVALGLQEGAFERALRIPFEYLRASVCSCLAVSSWLTV